MKNYLKKILTIGVTTLCLSGGLIYGAEDKPVLTLEEAIKSGFTYSDQLSLNTQEKELMRERLKANAHNDYEVYQRVYLEKAKSENQAQVIKDQINYDITNRYNSIIHFEKELLHLEHAISLKTKELEQVKVRTEVGTISGIHYEQAESELQELKNTQKAQLEFLSHEQSYFKLITGKDLTKYTLEDMQSFEAFRVPGSLDRYIETTITEYLKYDKELVQFAKDHVLIAGGQTVYFTDYLDKKYAADKSLVALEDVRKAMKDVLMNSYSSLLNLEEQISTLEIKRKLLQKQVDIVKIRVQVGRLTPIEYERQLLDLETVEIKSYELIRQYNSLKQVIQKPWAAIITKT